MRLKFSGRKRRWRTLAESLKKSVIFCIEPSYRQRYNDGKLTKGVGMIPIGYYSAACIPEPWNWCRAG